MPPVCRESALPLSHIHLQPAFQSHSPSVAALLLLDKEAKLYACAALLGVSNKTKHPNIPSHTFSGTCESFLHLGSSFFSGEHFPRYDLIFSRSSSSWIALWLLFKLDRQRNSPVVSVFLAVVGRCGGEERPCSWLAESVPSTRCRCRNLKPSTRNTPLTLTLWK